jgi:hypothetical protein
MGAQNMSNRFYSVHPRRNDRFLQASGLLQAIYREVDFAEFNFNKHMLGRLLTLSPERFQNVVDELRAAWVGRMHGMLRGISGKTVLLWFADHAPEDELAPDDERDPWFVTREMIEQLRSEVTEVVEIVASETALALGTEGMVFSQMETPAATNLMGPAAHQEAAEAVSAKLRDMIV